MSRPSITKVVLLFCLCFAVSKSYAWIQPPYIYIDDWLKHRPLSCYHDWKEEIMADLISGGPIVTWDWDWPPQAYATEQGDWPDHSIAEGKFNATGRYYVYATGYDEYGQSDSDWAKVYVFEMDLDISGVSDATEENPGGQLWAEGPLAEIYLAYEPSSLSPGYIELKTPSGGQNFIRVWADSGKTSLVIPDGSNPYKRWPIGSQPSSLYVEGHTHGNAELWLLYTPDLPPWYPGGEHNHDSVTFTVCDVCVSLCGATLGYWQEFMPTFHCPIEPGEFNQRALPDDCENRLAVFCDSSNSGGFEAFSWWYREAGQTGRGTEVGLCVWYGGVNQFNYKVTNKAYYGKERFLETEHSTKNDNKGSFWNQEGCPDYWCWKVIRFDCVSQSYKTGSPWWRRDDETFEYGWWENDGEPCTGPPYIHPTKQ
jgi:hypothetical protein